MNIGISKMMVSEWKEVEVDFINSDMVSVPVAEMCKVVLGEK